MKKEIRRALENGKITLKVEVHDAGIEAIKTNWDSLVFADNEDSLMSIFVGEYCFDLVTNGYIEVLWNNDGEEVTLTNEDYDLISVKAKSGEIYNDNFEIMDSNYFALMHGPKEFTQELNSTQEEIIDSTLLKDIKSIDQMIAFFANYVCDVLENIDDSILDVKPFVEIGEILEDGAIEKGQSTQGMVYWNQEAFYKKKGVCYVPELHEYNYTYNDFIEIAQGDEDLAESLFDNVDWQSPESLYNDWLHAGEIYECDDCNKPYLSYELYTCPHCGSVRENED